LKKEKTPIFTTDLDFDDIKNSILAECKETGEPLEEITDEAVFDEMSFLSDTAWKDLEGYMCEINRKMDTSTVILHGTCGTWMGDKEGGKIFKRLDEAISEAAQNVDYIDIYRLPDNRIEFVGSHHDGTNYWTIESLTKKGEAWLERNEHRYTRQQLIEHLVGTRGYTRGFKF
jgi:hypothetical protein